MIPRITTEADLLRLVEEQARETKIIEYKKTQYRFKEGESKQQAEQRREFLKDVSSFANTVGGQLIIGVEAQDGIPVAVEGIECVNIDAEVLYLDDLFKCLQTHPSRPLVDSWPAIDFLIHRL